jgi:ribose 5-phosphate isomerase B
MKVALGTDHAGFPLKEHLKAFLMSLGHEVLDCGCFSAQQVDYPVYVRPAAEAVARGEADRAIVLGGSGNGEAMCANKVRGVRCALCWSPEVAELARKHNDANVISLGARLTGERTAEQIVDVWLTTPFDGGRHERRVKMLDV